MMLVKYWMSKNLISVKETDSVTKAQLLIKEHNISRLPVMREGNLIGIISDRDIRQVLIPSETLKVKNIMTRDPVTELWDYTVGEAAEILLKHNISGLPVVDHQGRVVGIITKSDLFRVLVPLTGIERKGIQFALKLINRRGAINEITDIIRENGGRMMSILTSCPDEPEGYLRVYLRMYGLERKKLKMLKKKIMKKAHILYMVDHRVNTREIYADETASDPI
jgi:acetoin utilization protein AcuB